MNVEFREEIPLPPAEVYAYFRTPADWPRLYGAFGPVTDRGDGWYTVPLQGSPFPLIARITREVTDRRVAWALAGFWSGDGEVNLEPTRTGVLVTGHETLRIPGILGLGPRLERHIFQARFEAVWQSGWRRLRRMAETAQ